MRKVFFLLVLVGLFPMIFSKKYYWQVQQNISEFFATNPNPKIIGAQHNGTEVIIWTHGGMFWRAVSFDYGKTWQEGPLYVDNTENFRGKFQQPELKYSQGEWILIFTSSELPYRAFTVEARARPLFQGWDYLRHHRKSVVGITDNSLSPDQENHWLSSWIDNTTLRVEYNWTIITNCTENVLSHKLYNVGPGEWRVIYQTNHGIFLDDPLNCTNPIKLSNSSVKFILDSFLLVLETGESFHSEDGFTWGRRAQAPPHGYYLKDGILLAEGSTSFTNDNGSTWLVEMDNTSPQGLLFMVPELRLIHLNIPYLQVSTRKEVSSYWINTTTIIQNDQTIYGDLYLKDSLVMLNKTLTIIGDFIMAGQSSLFIKEGQIKITGNFTGNGNFDVTEVEGNLTVLSYIKHHGEFVNVSKLPCQQLIYLESSLQVIFKPSCSDKKNMDEGVPLWLILTIVGAVILTIVITTVLMILFRKKITPYHGRT